MCSCFLRYFYWDWCLDWEVTLCATLEFGPLGVAKGVCPSATRNGDPGELPRQIGVNSQKQILWGFMANRIEIAETNPPGFYGKSNSIGRLLNWDKGAAGRKRFLNVLTKKCLKRGKQRNVDRGHTNGTLNKWTKMLLHLEEKSNSLFNHLISIGTQWWFIFMTKTLDFFNFAKSCFIHYHKQACLL